MPKLFNLQRFVLAIATFAVMTLGSATVWADPITITASNAGGNGGTDNVLFNNGTLLHSGTLVQGNFSGGGSGFIVDFTSASGNHQIAGSGGQATISGLTGNNPFQSLTFGLEGGATFTNAILNPDSNANGNVTFTVNYISAAGSPSIQVFSVGANGNNFFHIDAGMGTRITSITFTGGPGVTFPDSSQFRLGGFAPAAVPEPASMLLLGTGLIGIGAGFRRRRKIKR